VSVVGPFLRVDYCAITEEATFQALLVQECVVV